MELDELIGAVKEAVSEQLEPLEERVAAVEKESDIDEALKVALEPIVSRLEAVEAALEITTEATNKALGSSKQADPAPVVTKSTETRRRDAWGRRVKSA